MQVSVIVPTFNRARYLGEALSSVLGQTRPPDEVLVVDDGSTDGTRDVLAGFEGRVAVHRQENAGKSVALNAGLERVTGEAVWIFDDDDVAVPDALARMAAALKGAPEAAFAYGGYDTFRAEEPGRHRSARLPGARETEDVFLASLYRSFVHQPALLVRRAAYDEAGPFDPVLLRSQDLDMTLRLAREGRGVRVPGVLFHQRHHDAPRGTGAAPIAADQIESSWARYDRAIISRVMAGTPLPRFAGRDARGEDAATLATANATRAAILARRAMWDEALAEAEAAGSATAQAGALPGLAARRLRPVLDPFGKALRSGLEEDRLRRLVAAFPAAARPAVRAALMHPLPGEAVHALRAGEQDKLALIGRAYAALGSPGAAVRHAAMLPSCGVGFVRELTA